MNILFLTNKSAFQEGVFGGAESSIRLLSEHLTRIGHSVHYVTKNRAGRVLPRMENFDVDSTNLHIFHTSFGYRRSRFLRRLNDWLLDRHLRTLIESQKFDVSYCFYELENVRFLLRMSERFGIPKVVMRMAGIQWYEMCRRNPKLIPAYESVFNRIDAVNYISSGLPQMVKQRLRELGMRVQFQREFVADIGSSVTPGRRIPYESLPSEPFRMVMATRFSNYQKRFDILVLGLSLIRERTRVQLKLIGDGGQRSEIEKMVELIGISDYVKFIPFLSQGELWQELENSHLLCHACDHEGLGKIIIESMAIGLPVLASDVAPLNSFIVEGQNGFLVANEPQEWAQKIEGLIENAPDRSRVSEQSIEWVKENYSPSDNVKLYVQEFENTIAHENE